MIKILNVNSCLDLKLGGGTAERTFQMTRFLAQQPATQCTVLTLDIDMNLCRIHALLPAKNVSLPCLWRRFYFPGSGWQIINRLVRESDVVHLMGHWSVLNYLVYLAARRANKPFVVCPAGALPIFGRSKILKRLYNFFIGYAIIRNAAGWIAITPNELLHFEYYGVNPKKVVVIPNGVNEDEFSKKEVDNFFEMHCLPKVPIILFMGRLNPIKGPDLLLQAFIKLRDQLASFHLVFAGPDGGLQTQLTNMAKQAGVFERVHFLGYLSGSEKSAAYHVAHLLVVPSRQEAMSIVAIEAGICGTPVLLTDQCGFSRIKEVDTRLEVLATTEGLAFGLLQLLSNPDILPSISSRLQNFVKLNFTWDAVGPAYIHLYERIQMEHKAQ